MPQDEERTALRDPDDPTGMAAKSRNRDAAAAIGILGCSEQDDVPAEPLDDDSLAAFDADGVVGQVIPKVADADANCHAARLRPCVRSVNRIVYVLCQSSVVIAW